MAAGGAAGCCEDGMMGRNSHVARYTTHKSHTSHVPRHTSHVTRHTSHVTRHTSHVTRHTSHVARPTSHVTRHTSHVTRHTSHVPLRKSAVSSSWAICGRWRGRGRSAQHERRRRGRHTLHVTHHTSQVTICSGLQRDMLLMMSVHSRVKECKQADAQA